ncbi:MAG: hypothetical protein B7X81_04720 [Hydrogenophilales bacterium 17-61-76]|nr:MAG: hypothetical protein B7Y21_01610 [Hydrogenophilales bacterium 16-61-112]OZA47845.1 MAG: hypothetical protein B7X81_04720 [Hydrogenophilales bacterium 17-61-76]
MSKEGFPLSQLYAARGNANSAPLADLILASEQIMEQSMEPWTFKSLAQNGREEFIRTGQIYEFDRWERNAQRSFAECIGRYIYYEEAEGLLFFVRDGHGKFRVAQPGDEAYDFVRRLNKEGSVSDLRFMKAPTWAEELFLGLHNFEAYKLIWYDNSGADCEAAKKLKSDTVIRETLRRMGKVTGLPITNEMVDTASQMPGEMRRDHEAASETDSSDVCSTVTVTLPHMTQALAAIFEIMRDNWTDCDPRRLPKQVNIAREIDRALGWGKSGDLNEDPSRNAKVVAQIIKPDVTPDTE